MAKLNLSLRVTASCAALVFTAACGGSGSAVVTPPTFVERAKAIEALSVKLLGDEDANIAGLAATRFDAIPTNGSASFTGSGAGIILLSEADERFVGLIGDARVVANFSTGTFSGGLTNIEAAQLQGTETPSDPGIVATDVTGRIALSGGSIVNNQFNTNYAGSLGIDGVNYQVLGYADGRFLGTRVGVVDRSLIKALALVDEDGTAVSGAATYPFLMTILGETR
jgi:hypothetical protein